MCRCQGHHQHQHFSSVLPSARVTEELGTGPGLSVLAALAALGGVGRKRKVGGGVHRTYPTRANIPHRAGSGPSSADLEWGTPQCVHYCSELQSGGHSFHPEESQGKGHNYTTILRLPQPTLVQWGLFSGVTHIPTWFLALWSAPALTSMSMISRLPDQAARWITVKPCFPKKRKDKYHLDEPQHIISVNKDQVNTEMLKMKK